MGLDKVVSGAAGDVCPHVQGDLVGRHDWKVTDGQTVGKDVTCNTHIIKWLTSQTSTF